MTSPSGRRTTAGLLLTGLLAMAGGLATWLAPTAQAVELGSFELRGESSGYTFYNDDASGARQAEGGTIPKTQTSLQTGPVGLGLASLAWPGPLAGNAGTLLLVLQPDLPPQTTQANYPIRAEARTGQNPPETTYEQVPGTSLKARATNDEVTALATVQNATGDPGTFGPTQSNAASRLTDAGGVVETSSLVEDVNIGGVIKIESVRSTARAVTDGTKATGEAKTVVTGLTIAGQPATVGEDGVTLGEQGQPANAIANQIAQQALASGGFEIFVSAPQKEIDGASANVTSGSLIITQSGDEGTTGIIIGQANAAVTGAPGFDFGGGEVVAPIDTGNSFTPPAEPGFVDVAPIDSGTIDVPATEVAAPAPAPTGGQPVALQPAVGIAEGRPITVGAIVLAMLGAALFAAGMRRLSDNVLAERAAVAACPLSGGAP